MDRHVTGDEWVVLLEAADEWGLTTIEPQSLRRLVWAWGPPTPSSLFSPNRYVLQASIRAADPALALSRALARWKKAVGKAGVPEWELVRAEIMTPEELERELDAVDSAPAGTLPPREQPRPDPEAEQEFLRRLFQDSVTGLPDKELFLREVRRGTEVSAASSTVQAVMILRIDVLGDGGRPVRETPPDDLLVEIAGRLSSALRPGDTVARVGAADFAVRVDLRSSADADRVARRVMETVASPSVRHLTSLTVRPTIGVATASADDAEQLFMRAEAASAAARRSGGRRHRSVARPGHP